LLFGAAYASVRLIHVVLFLSTRDDDELRDAVRRLTPTLSAGPAAVVAAGAGQQLTRPAVVMGVLLSASLWAAYFGQAAGAQARLTRADGLEQAQLARDAYSYLQLLLVGGVVLFASGVQVAIEGVEEPMAVLPAAALCGGVALFFAAEVAYRWRNHHILFKDRLVTAATALALIPLAVAAPALVTLIALPVLGALRAGWEARHGLPMNR